MFDRNSCSSKLLTKLITSLGIVFSISLPSIAQQTLTIYTWSEYMDPEVVAEFEQAYDTTIEFNYFESDQARDEELAAVAGRGYDLLLVNRTQVERYGKRGWLEPIDWSTIPNAEHIDQRWMDAFQGPNRYAIPYFWGTMGIAYRKDMVPEGFDSWMDLFQPDEQLRDKIIMISDSRELTALALKATGHSVNSGDSKHLKEARELLMGQRPYIQQYAYPSLGEDSSLLTGDVWAASMYNGDVMMLQDQDDNIAYSIPKEGGLMWIDYFTIAQASTNKALAHQFLNYINQPAIAARMAEWVFYSSPNLAALELMSSDYLDNPVINPVINPDINASTNLRKDIELIQALPPRARKQVNSIGADLFRGLR